MVFNIMTLKDFVKRYVCSNTILRLWAPKNGWNGYVLLYVKDERKPDGVDDVCMDWELIHDKCWQSKYCDCKVLGVKDIVVDGFYREAVNIVIDTEADSDIPTILDTTICEKSEC